MHFTENLNLGKYKQYVQKILIWRTIAKGFVAEERIPFVIQNTMTYLQNWGMEVNCKALCVTEKKKKVT